MDSLIKSDIFFFISSVAVVVITILLVIVLGYAIYLLNMAKSFSKKVKYHAGLLEGDIEDARSYIKEQGLTLKTLIKFATSTIKKRIKTK